MLKGISDSLLIRQPSHTLVAATAKPEKPLGAVETQVSSIPTYRLESYRRWAKVTQGQHKISASQVAEQGLQQMIRLLAKLKLRIGKARTSSGDEQAQHIIAAEKIQTALAQFTLQYQGAQLLDHQLNIISNSRPATPRQFTLRSVELAQAKPRDERILMQFDKTSVSILLPAHQGKELLRAHLSHTLKATGITLAQTSDLTSIYTCDERCWQQIKPGILMTGQGQRLPAGEARMIKVEELLNWQDPRQWRFNDDDALKQSQAKVTKSLFKVRQQLQDLNEAQTKILQQMQRLNLNLNSEHSIDAILSKLDELMQPTPFALHMASIMAQANITRSQVSSLLET